MNSHSLYITTRSVFLFIGAILGLYFLYLIHDILILLFVAVIFMSALNPLIDSLERKNAPRWLAILTVYIITACFLGILLWGVLPVLFLQIRDFILSTPALISQALTTLNLSSLIEEFDLRATLPDLVRTLSDQLIQTPANIFRYGVNVFGQFLNVFTLLVFTFYLLLEHRKLKEHIAVLVPAASQDKLLRAIEKAENKLGAWLRGELVLMTMIGVLTLIGLSLLQIRFAVSLAIIAGLLEIIPIIGPVVATVPAVMVALTQSPWHAIAVVFMYIFIQQLEQTILVPRVMKSAVGLDPLAVILAIMIGNRLGGPAGALIAIPVTVVLIIIWHEYREAAFQAPPDQRTSKE